MTLSVIMPVFNASQTVANAVRSVGALADRLDDRVRLLAIDDCSTDTTPDVLQALRTEYSFLELYRMRHNTGPGPARNHALAQVSEGWVGFIDADDEIIPDAYADCFRQGEDAGADFVTFNGYFINGSEISAKYDFDRICDDRKSMIRRSLRSELDGSVIFSIFKNSLIEGHDLRFGDFFYEDIPFAHLGIIFADRRQIINRPCYKKHWLGSSIVNTVSDRHVRGLLTTIVHVRTRLEQAGYYDPALDPEFAYGAHGYIARAVIDVVRSTRHSNEEKLSLLATIAEELERSPVLSAMPKLVQTRKDKICTGMRRIAEQGRLGEPDLAELTRLVENAS